MKRKVFSFISLVSLVFAMSGCDFSLPTDVKIKIKTHKTQNPSVNNQTTTRDDTTTNTNPTTTRDDTTTNTNPTTTRDDTTTNTNPTRDDTTTNTNPTTTSDDTTTNTNPTTTSDDTTRDDTTTNTNPITTSDDTDRGTDDEIIGNPGGGSGDTETGRVQNYDVRMARMVQEYHLVNNLVSHSITHETVDSGNWSDPAVWKGGRVPSEGARIWIHEAHRVILNRQLADSIRTIRLDGELDFNPHKNTRLIVDTMVTGSNSILRIGEPSVPVDADKKSVIVIHDYNEEGMITTDPKSDDYDPLRIGQGILTNGLFFAHGTPKTPYGEITGKGVGKGSRTVALDETPQGWQNGDTVVILGTAEEGTQAERRTITSISGNRVQLDAPLAYDHFVPETTIDDLKLKVHMANLSRNIIVRTDPEVLEGKGDKNDPNNVEHRGHVLFMHNNNVNLNGVAFVDLGRTNKRYVLNETEFASEEPNAKATRIGTNQAARYPVHFHRAGLDDKLGRISHCVIDASPGWGYVNHSSNVIMKENIAYGVYGAAFITEAGDENGKFIANMAIATRGYGPSDVRGWKQRMNQDDWGFGGNGFWLLGPHVDIVDNIVNGSSNSAFAFTRQTIDSVTGVIKAEDETELPYDQASMKSFVNNIAYGNTGGVFGILSGTRQSAVEKLHGLLAWSNGPFFSGSGRNPYRENFKDYNLDNNELISWWYPSKVELYDITIVGDIHHPKYTGIGTNTKLRHQIIKNARIEGMQKGILIPEYYGNNIVEDGYYNNVINMFYNLGTTNKGANTRIQGNIAYGDLPGNIKQSKIAFALAVRDVSWKNYWLRQYNTFNIVYAPEGETPMKLYATREQSPDFTVAVGRQKGKTNRQLIKEGHRPVGGVLVPENAIAMPGMTNVSGVPAN